MDVRAQAREHGFGALADELASLARPALMLEPPGTHRPVGRLGGLPHLPPGTPWPLSRLPGTRPEPLAFIAELDLAALGSKVWPGPHTGRMSVFCAIAADALYVDTGGAALVMLHEPGDPLEFPEDLPEALRFKEQRVKARAATTLPRPRARELTTLVEADDEDYYDLMRAVARLPEGRAPCHQLLGWPKFLQDDVAYTWPGVHNQAVGYGLSHGEVADWRLLLQIDSDRRFAWGDGGVLLFGIPEADLRDGRFDRVQAVTDSL